MSRHRITALLAVVLAAPASAYAVVPPGNLLVNPGAEDGPGATTRTDAFPPPGWDTLSTTGFTAVAYGSADFPTTGDSAAIGGGANFFAGGNTRTTSNLQVIDLSSAAAEIDAGQVRATLSGFLGGFAGELDSSQVRAEYVDAASRSLGTALLLSGPGPTERSSTTSLLPRTASGGVPAGTRAVRVVVQTSSLSGYNNGYADSISFSLGSGTGQGGTGEQGAIGGPTAARPVRGTSVQVRELRGRVTVLLPPTDSPEPPGTGRAQAAQARFVPLNQVASIPIGSIVNTVRGTVRLTSAQGGGRGQLRSVTATRGTFEVIQLESARAATNLNLQGGNFSGCTRGSRRRVRLLKVRGRGNFRTRSRYASATVRSTDWTMTDRCDGTLTTVRSGSVRVRDLVRRRTILVRAGGRYLARPR